MFKKNTKHLQPAIISAASELPEKQRKRLESSWAGTFYNQFFYRIKEEAFAILYSDIPSRPNVPVNVLIGLEALKAGCGWSDQELYENYCYNLQVRYALGYDRLGDGDFEIRTLYYFRERLSRYNAEQGINLLEKAFELLAMVMDDKERDVRKAAAWILREITKANPDMVAEFLAKQAQTFRCKDKKRIIIDGMKKLNDNDRRRITELLE